MNRIWLVLLSTLLGTGCHRTGDRPATLVDQAAAQRPGVSQKHIVRELPPLCLDHETHLLDTVVLVNDTNDPLQVTDVRRSCTCALIDFKPGAWLPGQELRIEARATLPVQKSGPWSHAMTLVHGETEVAKISTRAFVYRTLEADREAIRAESLSQAGDLEQTVTFTYRSLTAPPSIAPRVSAAHGRIQPSLGESISAHAAGLHQMDFPVRIRMPKDPHGGSQSDDLIFQISGAPILTVPITWGPRSRVAIVPPRGFLKIPPSAREPVTQTLILRTIERDITPRCKSHVPGLVVEFEPTAQKSQWLVRLTADPALLAPESARIQVQIETGWDDEAFCVLPITLFRE